MTKKLKRNIKTKASTGHADLVDRFIHTEQSLHKLPELSPAERVALEQEVAISHLYHSSAIEGTTLNIKRLDKATRPTNA